MPEDLTSLRQAIQDLHGCDSVWVAAVPVHEAFEGLTVWDGEVHVFDLIGPPHRDPLLRLVARYGWREAPVRGRAAPRTSRLTRGSGARRYRPGTAGMIA